MVEIIKKHRSFILKQIKAQLIKKLLKYPLVKALEDRDVLEAFLELDSNRIDTNSRSNENAVRGVKRTMIEVKKVVSRGAIDVQSTDCPFCKENIAPSNDLVKHIKVFHLENKHFTLFEFYQPVGQGERHFDWPSRTFSAQDITLF
jgi:hypothetical protein